MKYLRFIFLTVVIFFFFPISVSADDVIDLHEFHGLEYQDFIDSLDDLYTTDFPIPSFLDDSLDYIVEENIKLSSNGVLCSWTSDYSGSSTIPFGNVKVVTNSAKVLNLILYNDGEVLFENPGTFNLLLNIYGKTVVVQTTSNGVITSNSYEGSPSGYISIPVSIDNSLANLTKVQIIISNGLEQSSGDVYIAGGIIKYGYILDEVVGPDPDPVVPGDTSGIFTFLFGFVFSYVESLFLLEFVNGVTFGYFILACAILGVVFSFFLSRLIK